MADKKDRLVLDDFSGGRNGADPPLGPTFGANQVTDAVNGDWYRTAGFRKRNGNTNISMTGSSLTGKVSWLGRHVPGTLEADAELWALDDSGTTNFSRLDNSVTWTTPTTSIGITIGTNIYDISSASLNGFFIIAFPSGLLHLYDPTLNTIRVAGMPTPLVPTAANGGGAGAYAATLRYYRTRYLINNGLSQVASEPSTSVAFTPSGANANATVTLGGVSTDQAAATHWNVEGSTDNVTFYFLAQVVIGTTTYADTAAPASYSAGPLSALSGTFTMPKPYRYLAADGGRLIGFGSWTSTDKQNRLTYGAIIGSLNVGDAERVDTTTKYYDDLDENDSGVPTGLMGPVWGNFYAFKSRQIWELSATGSLERPYRLSPISKELGCVQGHAVCRGEDAHGNPCLYFMTHRGVYRYGAGGLTYIGRGIEDLILGPTSVMNMAATKVIAHMVYHPDKRQVWCWFATGSSNDPDTQCIFDVMANGGKGGWARHTGNGASARCSVMFANSLGATMGFSLVPYTGSSTVSNRVKRQDDAAVTDDAGTNIQASITTRPIRPGGPGYKGTLGDVLLLAPVASGVTITATVTPDFGGQPPQTGTVSLTAAGSETRIASPANRFSDTAVSGAEYIQLTIGDGSAISNAWSIDAVTIPIKAQEAVS